MNTLTLLTLLLYTKLALLTYLSSGINKLNNLVYLQRLSDFIYQSTKNKCSLEDGSHCFYIEPYYLKALEKENNLFQKNYIEKEWLTLKDSINIYSIQEKFDELSNNMNNYIQKISNNNDEKEKIPTQENQIIITFDNYDHITIQKDIILERKTFVNFYNDKIPIIMDGKIRLKYDKSKSKIIIKDIIDYPSKTYGVIESTKLILSLEGKQFKCISFYARPKSMFDENSKVTVVGTISKNIAIEGYNHNKMVFSINYKISYYNEGYWTKILISNDLFITKLIFPGEIEIDNILLSVENNKVYDIQSLFYNDPKRKTIDLISDNDI